MIFHGILVIAIVSLITSAAQNTCKGPTGQNGTCVSIQFCPVLLKILEPRIPSSAEVERLKQYTCGFDDRIPKVCCPKEVSEPSVAPPIPSRSWPEKWQNPIGSVPPFPNVNNHKNLRLLNHDICGEITGLKIFGGVKTGVLDYPWMALLAYKGINSKEKYRCAGTVINHRYILTAAHCLPESPSTFTLSRVRIGEHNLITNRDCDRDPMTGEEIVCADGYQDFGIENTIHHPKYSPTSKHDDIGLIRVDGEIDFRPDNVKPICLPIGNAANLEHKSAIVTGWGTTEIGPISLELLQVTLPIVSPDECTESYRDREVISYKQLCAGGTKGKDTCSGDSGGPLQAPGNYNNNNKYVQYGIVSYGTRTCAVEGYPGVYTQVAHYTDWILDNMRD